MTPQRGGYFLFRSSQQLHHLLDPWRDFRADTVPFKGLWLKLCVGSGSTEKQGNRQVCWARPGGLKTPPSTTDALNVPLLETHFFTLILDFDKSTEEDWVSERTLTSPGSEEKLIPNWEMKMGLPIDWGPLSPGLATTLILLHRSLIVKSHQRRIELVTGPGRVQARRRRRIWSHASDSIGHPTQILRFSCDTQEPQWRDISQPAIKVRKHYPTKLQLTKLQIQSIISQQ